jgi:hypothetical protein
VLFGSAKYFAIRAHGAVPGQKMRIYDVVSHSQQESLAKILWWGRWRQYIIEPRPGTIWSADCLACIQIFIERLMKDWRESKGHVANE